MKKLISFLISLALCVPCAVFSDEIDVQSVAEALKQQLAIPENYTEFNSYADISDNTSYAFSWSGGNVSDGGSVNVTLDGKQRIITYNQYRYGKYNGDYKLSEIDYNGACTVADEFLKRAAPEFSEHLRLFPQSNYISRNSGSYDILYYRSENGIPCYDNYAVVNVDAYTKTVSEYSIVWEDYDYITSASSVVSQDEALKKFASEFGLELAYSRAGDEITLVYSINGDGTQFINAYTAGSVKTGLSPGASALMYTKKTQLYDNLHETENGNFPAMADSRLKNNSVLGITAEHVISDTKYLEDDSGNPFCEITYENAAGSTISVTINSHTYDTVRFSSERKATENSKMLSDAACAKIASNYASRYIKSIYKSCRGGFSIPSGDANIYKIKFPLYVNGIPYSDNGIIIEVDRADGRILSFEAVKEENIDFPLSIASVSEQRAYEILIQNAGFAPMYVPVLSGGAKELRAVYWFSPVYPLYVNAQSGALCTNEGYPYKVRTEPKFSDIENSSSKHQIQTLALAGIFKSDGGEFMPEEFMTGAEFAQVLSTVFEKDISADRIDGYITHEQAAELVVNALGYKDVAYIENAYEADFVDRASIDRRLLGCAAIAKGLGLVNGNAFLPKRYVTRAYCAELIYNTIVGRTDDSEG